MKFEIQYADYDKKIVLIAENGLQLQIYLDKVSYIEVESWLKKVQDIEKVKTE